MILVLGAGACAREADEPGRATEALEAAGAREEAPPEERGLVRTGHHSLTEADVEMMLSTEPLDVRPASALGGPAPRELFEEWLAGARVDALVMDVDEVVIGDDRVDGVLIGRAGMGDVRVDLPRGFSCRGALPRPGSTVLLFLSRDRREVGAFEAVAMVGRGGLAAWFLVTDGSVELPWARLGVDELVAMNGGRT